MAQSGCYGLFYLPTNLCVSYDRLLQIDEYAPGLTDKAAEYGTLGWQYTKEIGAIGYGYAVNGVTWINKTAFE